MRRFAKDLLRLTGFVVCLCAARSSLADHYVVPTGSMRPTVLPGDRVLVNHVAYDVRAPFVGRSLAHTGDPERGDVVTLTSPENGDRLLKRVVAVPGDLVSVRGGRIAIAGVTAPIDAESRETLGRVVHGVRLTQRGGADFGPVLVPAGKYLLLGDNRGESRDGRSFGFVDRDAITGRAIGVFWRDGAPAWGSL
jgi:signal peptidase I